MTGVRSIFELIYPSEGEVWSQKLAPLRAGLGERLMGLYRRQQIGPHNHHTLAVGPRKTWFDGMAEGEYFFELWPRVLEALDFLIKDNDRESCTITWLEMPHPRLLAEAMDICGIPYHLVSQWVHDIDPHHRATPFTAGHVIDGCSGLREVGGNDQKADFLSDVYHALIIRKREDLILPPKSGEC